ncbi:MAG: insulinase family protein, partial [Bacteroidales bacterium]|nr:insulinase family protein [Bacteroidales bacterium]
ENPAASVYVIYNGISDYNLRKDIMMDIFSQIMDIVYTETIREQEGGTYGVGTSASINNLNDEWMFLFGFDTNVEKQEYLKNRAKEELMKVVKNGVSAEKFNKVKEYMLKQYDNNQRENSYWNEVLTNRVFHNNIETGYKQALESISTRELNIFLRSLFLDNENLVEVVMCGEAK